MARLPCHVEPLRRILDKMDAKIKTTPPPISIMEKMARFRCSASTSLNLGGGGGELLFLILFYPRLSEVHTGVTRTYVYYVDRNPEENSCRRNVFKLQKRIQPTVIIIDS